ncbi:MAG: alginate export family protein [Bacteroidetes bacterium]|nr:alginate export family protein [Bacteroidota bacterium]
MKITPGLLTIAICLFVTIDLFAQSTIDGEIRPRFEYRHGYNSIVDSGQAHAAFVDQRTRLNFGHKTEGYQMRISLQDIRAWGSQPQLNSTDGLSSIHEAWGEAFINKKLSLKFGRQEIILDDHRIFGNAGWEQQARSHDAVIFKIKTDSTFKLQIGGAYNQDKAQMATTFYSVPKSYKALQYLWAHKNFSKTLGVSVLVLNLGNQASRIQSGALISKDVYNQTIGTRLEYKKDKVKVGFNGYYQTGTRISGDGWTNSTITAGLLHIEASYKLTKKLTGVAGYETLSGTDPLETNKLKNNSFNPYFGTNHLFNGYMDYYYVGNHANSVGLTDLYLKLKFKSKKFEGGTDLHIFYSAQNVLDNTDTTGQSVLANTSLGTEIDLYGGFKLSKGVTLKFGYSHYFSTPTLGMLKGITFSDGTGRNDQINNWGWAMIVMKPKFLAGKKTASVAEKK